MVESPTNETVAQAQAGHRFFAPFVSAEDKVVVVLGAGASISEMLTTNQEPLPPTDANFIEIARDCANAKYAEMEAAFDELWKGAEPWPLKYQKMEALFSSAFLRVQQTSGRSREGRAARRLYDSLVEMLRDTLSDTTGKAQPNQHLSFFSALASQHPSSLNVISFNYDVLADRALLGGARRGIWSWSHRDGYGFSPANQGKPRESSSLKLLKLHGSMNWYIPTPGRTRAKVYVKRTPVYVPNPATNPNSVPWQRRQHRHGHSSRSIFPLMVPPVFEKGNQIVGVLQDVWGQAASLLREATVVFVWGYSLPQTDYHAEVLFAQSARQARHHLIAINPCRAALARVTDVCGHTWNRWYFKMEHVIRDIDSGA